MSYARSKGTAAETALVRYLQQHGWPYAERRALAGALDKGDVTGTPGICWEVKAARTWNIAGWMREAESERLNSGAKVGVLVVKPTGVGDTRVGDWLAVVPGREAAGFWPAEICWWYGFRTFPAMASHLREHRKGYPDLPPRVVFDTRRGLDAAFMLVETVVAMLHAWGFGDQVAVTGYPTLD